MGGEEFPGGTPILYIIQGEDKFHFAGSRAPHLRGFPTPALGIRPYLILMTGYSAGTSGGMVLGKLTPWGVSSKWEMFVCKTISVVMCYFSRDIDSMEFSHAFTDHVPQKVSALRSSIPVRQLVDFEWGYTRFLSVDVMFNRFIFFHSFGNSIANLLRKLKL